MNKNIVTLNGEKGHQPIFKVRTYEPKGNKFNVGFGGNKKDKFVIAAKGTNLFFAVYWDGEKQKRNFETIPLNEVIEHQKWRALLPKEERENIPLIPTKAENGRFLFSLSPNDLVYIPDEDERVSIKNIYKVVSFTGNRLYAIPYSVAVSIVDKIEFTQLNKLEFTIEKKSIKENCIKLIIDRLGNISPSL